MEQKEIEIQQFKGLDYYRLRKPFQLLLVGTNIWRVQDKSTFEYAGILEPVGHEKSTFQAKTEDFGGQIHKLENLNKNLLNKKCTPEEAAWDLWKVVYPLQWKVWNVLHLMALAFDRGFRFIDIIVRGALVLFAAWYLLDWAWFVIAEVRDPVKDIIREWLAARSPQNGI